MVKEIRKQTEFNQARVKEYKTILKNVGELRGYVKGLLVQHDKMVSGGEHSDAAHKLTEHLFNEILTKYNQKRFSDLVMVAHLHGLDKTISKVAPKTLYEPKKEIANPNTRKLLLDILRRIDAFEKGSDKARKRIEK